MTTLAAFVATRLGTSDTVDHVGSGQCVDLVNDYLKTVCAKAYLVGNAVDLYANAPAAAYTKIRNAPTNYPPVGAVVTWGPAPTVGIGPNGHTAVVLLADETFLVTLDQNWPEGSAVAVVVHYYVGVQGWFIARA